MLKIKKLNKLLYFILLMIICINTLGLSRQEEKEKKIHPNITIENIDIGNLTKAQAEKKLNKIFKLEDLNIIYDNNTWVIKHEDFSLDYHIKKYVEEAFNYTRTDSIYNNIKRKTKLYTSNNYNIKIKATYNEIQLSKQLEKITKQVNKDAIDATFTVKESGELKRTESKDGKQVNIPLLKEKIYNMINKKKIENIELPVLNISPKILTKDVESINTILGQFSTSFNNNTSRGSNIHVAGESTSDVLLMPGETFSYNKTTGARTWNNGYKAAPIIVGGRVVQGEGGGVCQVSTTIYNAALLSGLTIEEVHNHSLTSRYAPRGRDATVAYGYTDLKFKNKYNHPIYIKNIVSNGSITCKIYGCNLDRSKIIIKMREKYTQKKITVKTYRIYLDEEDNLIRRELVNTSIYKPY